MGFWVTRRPYDENLPGLPSAEHSETYIIRDNSTNHTQTHIHSHTDKHTYTHTPTDTQTAIYTNTNNETDILTYTVSL